MTLYEPTEVLSNFDYLINEFIGVQSPLGEEWNIFEVEEKFYIGYHIKQLEALQRFLLCLEGEYNGDIDIEIQTVLLTVFVATQVAIKMQDTYTDIDTYFYDGYVQTLYTIHSKLLQCFARL